MKEIIGPFTQIITFSKAALEGPLQTHDMNIVQNAGVCVDSGFIVEVGPFDYLVKNEPSNKVMEISVARVLTPGLIDCRTPMVRAGVRVVDLNEAIVD